MEILRREFTDPLRSANARSEIESIKYAEGSDLASFIRKFEATAIDAEMADHTMKESLLKKLPRDWNVALWSQAHSTVLTFSDFKLYTLSYYERVYKLFKSSSRKIYSKESRRRSLV